MEKNIPFSFKLTSNDMSYYQEKMLQNLKNTIRDYANIGDDFVLPAITGKMVIIEIVKIRKYMHQQNQQNHPLEEYYQQLFQNYQQMMMGSGLEPIILPSAALISTLCHQIIELEAMLGMPIPFVFIEIVRDLYCKMTNDSICQVINGSNSKVTKL